MAKHNKKENSYKELENGLKCKGVKYYNAKNHIACTSLMMVACTMVFIFGFPWLINFVVTILKQCNWMEPDNFTDFLGGFIGVVIGFLFDLWFIERIRNINRFSKLVKVLISEMIRILKGILCDKYTELIYIYKFLQNSNDIENGIFNISDKELSNKVKADNNMNKISEAVGEFCKVDNQINRWAIDDIVSSIENDSLFANLPGHPSANLSILLHDINACIICFNNGEEKDVNCINLIIKISLFIFMTDKEQIEKLMNESTNSTAGGQ